MPVVIGAMEDVRSCEWREGETSEWFCMLWLGTGRRVEEVSVCCRHDDQDLGGDVADGSEDFPALREINEV